MKLYYFPRSTYCQKALLAFHEKQVAFTPVAVYPGDPQQRAELAQLTPLGKVPLLILDDGWKIPESTIIIEYLDTHFATGTRLIPEDPDRARQTRFHDRLTDLYINDSLTKLLFDGRKPEDKRDPEGAAKARKHLDMLFAGFDDNLSKRAWIMGDSFTMADCSLVACLGIARDLHPYDRWKHLTAYAQRAFERPSYAAMQADSAVEAPGAKVATA